MSYFSVDVESDGEVPPIFSMVCFGAVLVEPGPLDQTFYGQTAPVSTKWKPDALAVSGFTRDQHLTFRDPYEVMLDFDAWVQSLNKNGRPIFISDNPAYDWQFINYYFHRYLGKNPFGHSARRIGDLYCGLMKDTRARWKHLRTTKHTHHPVDDAKGNAEALLAMKALGLHVV